MYQSNVEQQNRLIVLNKKIYVEFAWFQILFIGVYVIINFYFYRNASIALHVCIIVLIQFCYIAFM